MAGESVLPAGSAFLSFGDAALFFVQELRGLAQERTLNL